MLARYLALLTLLGSAVILSSCSYSTDFVIVNESVTQIVVRYRVKNHPGPFSPPGPPSIRAADSSSRANNPWSKLTSDRLQLDEAHRTVTVTVSPHEALLIANMHHYVSHDNEWDAKEFPIEEINVSGSHGELTVSGDQARRSFSKISVALYTLTYK